MHALEHAKNKPSKHVRLQGVHTMHHALFTHAHLHALKLLVGVFMLVCVNYANIEYFHHMQYAYKLHRPMNHLPEFAAVAAGPHLSPVPGRCPKLRRIGAEGLVCGHESRLHWRLQPLHEITVAAMHKHSDDFEHLLQQCYYCRND